MTNTPDDVAVPAEGWPTDPAGEQPQPQPVQPGGEAEEIEVTDPLDPNAELSPEAENDSNYRPEGWVEGELHPGADPIPDENAGDDAGVDEDGNERPAEEPAES